MTEIGTYHQQGFGSAPQFFDDLGDLSSSGLANHQRDKAEVFFQHRLQKRQLNLEAVLFQVRVIKLTNMG